MANKNLPVNDQTQAVLNKYGITAPKKITNIQNIQNKTETDINIVQPDIKVSAPNIKINPVDIAIQRYKNWVEGAYGRQKNIADKQKEDLEEKDYTLRKALNRVFHKIEDLRNQIVDKARGFKRSLDSSLAPLVTLFIASIVPVIWKPLMKRVETLEQGFRYLFFGEVPPGISEGENSFSFATTIRKFLGMDDSEGKTLLQGIGDVISEGVKKLLRFLDIQKDDRVQAVKEVLKNPAPGFDWTSASDWWNARDKLGENFEYLGDLMTAITGGSDALAKRQGKRDTVKSILKDKDTRGPNGVSSQSGKWINHAIKEKTPAASYYMSEQAVKYISKPGTKEYDKLEFLLGELENIANEFGEVYVSQGFAEKFLGKEKTKELENSKDLKRTHIDVIADRKKKGYNLGYFNETPRMYGLWKTQDQYIQGHTPYAYKSYIATPKVFSEAIKGNKEDFITEKHQELHGAEVSQKAQEVRSVPYAGLKQVSENTQKRLSELKTAEDLKHFNNFGTIDTDFELGNKNSETPPFDSNGELTKKVIEQAENDMGKITYNYGGNAYYNTDCSGYVSNVYKKFGVNVPRGSENIYDDAQKGQKATWVDKSTDSNSALQRGNYEPRWDQLKPGDIMLWSRYKGHAKDRKKREYVGHVSLFTGKYDKEGKPIILGHSGPGPNPEKGVKGKKGTTRQGLNDIKSYLGTVRYNTEKVFPETSSQEKADPGDGDIPEKNISTEQKPKSTINNVVPETYTASNITKVKKDNIIPSSPEIYKKSENNNSEVTIDSKVKQEVKFFDKDKYYSEIINNISETIDNCKTSVVLKKMHAEQMTT